MTLQELTTIIKGATNKLVQIPMHHSTQDKRLPNRLPRGDPQKHTILTFKPEPTKRWVATFRITLQPIFIHSLRILVDDQSIENAIDFLVEYSEGMVCLDCFCYFVSLGLGELLPGWVCDAEAAVPG